jgi:hypothetical protein
MSLDMKIFLAMAPVCFVAMVYALTQGEWESAGFFVFLEVLTVICYRTEKRLHREP